MFKVATKSHKSCLYLTDRLIEELCGEVPWNTAVNYKLQNKFEKPLERRSERGAEV